jgi:hypothetical protein
MKVEIFENDFGMDFTVIPETVEDMAKLLRFTNNAKAEKPKVSMYFNGTPSMTVWLRKIHKSKQVNYITTK